MENNVTYDENFGYFKIYSSVAVELTDIIWTAGKFYGNEWFSDVVVSSEETDWYGKVWIFFLLSIFNWQLTKRFITLLV